MAKSLNKRVLCFVDEHGVAGQGALHMGAVLVLAREAGRVDKCFSDRLEGNANEAHASAFADAYLQGLLQRFWGAVPRGRVVLINQKAPANLGSPPSIYAQAVVHTVKAGLKRFKADVLGKETIGNVELILDRNGHNTHPAFDAEMERAQDHDGRFKGVNHVTKIDSAACRLLQLADCVAYARKWIVNEDLNAGALRARFGIQLP